mmetsp:Transcript_94848/g.203771  ORF Transcript_94848/g.203771 Transcript_94848/m.203771 type:complete len:220 (+) Transcript_94848:240-899(+)
MAKLQGWCRHTIPASGACFRRGMSLLRKPPRCSTCSMHAQMLARLGGLHWTRPRRSPRPPPPRDGRASLFFTTTEPPPPRSPIASLPGAMPLLGGLLASPRCAPQSPPLPDSPSRSRSLSHSSWTRRQPDSLTTPRPPCRRLLQVSTFRRTRAPIGPPLRATSWTTPMPSFSATPRSVYRSSKSSATTSPALAPMCRLPRSPSSATARVHSTGHPTPRA